MGSWKTTVVGRKICRPGTHGDTWTYIMAGCQSNGRGQEVSGGILSTSRCLAAADRWVNQ